MEENVEINVEGVGKDFKLPHEKFTSIKSAVVNFYRRKKGYEIHHALKGISFAVKQGEFFGIVGRNGSGKSTLLKLLAGIYEPTKGNIVVRGSLTPFIELGVGFNPDLTGRENLYLNGALLGFNRKEMQAMYKDIVEFAELERFMDQKLKNYSSGMQVRLAFSIAVRAQSDILLIDEVLAVGDLNFQEKCFLYFEKLKKEGRTIIFITHDMSSIIKFCDRAALMSAGEIKFIGDPKQVAELYEKQNASEVKLFGDPTSIRDGLEIEALTIKNTKSSEFNVGDKITLRFRIKANRKATFVVGINLLRDNQFISGITSQKQLGTQELISGGKMTYEFTFSSKQLNPGFFTVDGVIYEIGRNEPVFFKTSMAHFKILDGESGWGLLNLQGSWDKL